MKKNLLSVIILALLVVNIALTGVMMFSTISANKKTVALVDQIASILNMEVKAPTATDVAKEVSILDTDTYNIADEMVITLKKGEDGAEHYAIVSISMSLDKTDERYAELQPLVAANESKIKSVINDTFGKYTKEEASANQKAIADEILTQLQTMFDSTFIYEVYYRDIKFQ
ncbi:MAG: flagellar basal body-associated FliL family protein [Lachnospiraceae bacterium]|nr:flagellar basal body-associated FliL family protein [Lachnospiraceae bacterium]